MNVDEQLRENLGPVLAPRVTDPVRTAQSELYDLFTPDGEHLRPQPFAWLQLAYQPGLLDAVRWTEGSAPDDSGPRTVRTASDGSVPLLSVALLEDVLETLDLEGTRAMVSRAAQAARGLAQLAEEGVRLQHDALTVGAQSLRQMTAVYTRMAEVMEQVATTKAKRASR